MIEKRVRTKALPTIVWQYGCKFPDKHDAVIDQMRLANRYRNRLCEIERDRRAAADAIVHADELAAMREQIDAMTARITEIHEARKARNAKLRKRTALTADEKAEVDTLKERRRPLCADYKARKIDAYKGESNRAALEAIDEAAKAATKEARRIASHEWGLFWGTYTLIEADATKFRKGPPPRFRGFRGDGMIGAQVQSNEETRVTTDDISELGGCLQFRIAKIDARHANVSVLIGATDPARRISPNNPPVYATVRATIHRPLPDGAHVSWVRLIRRKIGTNYKWFVQFVLARAEGWDKVTGDEVIGWDDVAEVLMDGSIRVARWAGSDGDTGEVRLPTDLIATLKHKAELQSLHDEKFNVARASLIGWIEARPANESLPDWFTEATKTIKLWRGASRLAGLIVKWRDNRFDGDAGIFAAMESYRKDAKHLWNWACHEHSRALRRRDEIYKTTSRLLARKYGTLGVRPRKPPVPDNEVARFAAVSRCRELLVQGGLALIVIPGGEGNDSAVEILRAVQCRENPPEHSNDAS